MGFLPWESEEPVANGSSSIWMISHHHSFSATFQVNPDMVPEYKSNMVQRHFISARRHIIRPTDQGYAQGYNIMFTDCFTFLIASQDSLDALNENLKEHVPMNHFRPNILVDGCQPYLEDPWKIIKINNLIFEGVKLCNHCKSVYVFQEPNMPDIVVND
ncbi:uncharacterized protein YcbX-like isoform X3 [Panicum virgatum]|uniref:uncharacterized protein YcbX-like isoform X3 n=1 Tax=Panicum virgatum TaxID=38727 RepID=UPI0019D58913|nr:uncharacterized protein YcbX-like isoform X3 [Panicum virgatum]XP_039830649.1 uncharacterized protein YcbX-like isoform X3 [Panicum virgatum]XP_039830651.1 uncharacterized protein YcbX-like isoform X3 [Panicum virgatum]